MTRYKVAEQIDLCPHCGCREVIDGETIKEVRLDQALYLIEECNCCKGHFANAFLLIYDEDRPDDEMEVEL